MRCRHNSERERKLVKFLVERTKRATRAAPRTLPQTVDSGARRFRSEPKPHGAASTSAHS